MIFALLLFTHFYDLYCITKQNIFAQNAVIGYHNAT